MVQKNHYKQKKCVASLNIIVAQFFCFNCDLCDNLHYTFLFHPDQPQKCKLGEVWL